jgi:hypothetical protein
MPIIAMDIYPSEEVMSLPQLCELLSIKMPVIDLSSQEAKNRDVNNFIKYLRNKVKEDTTIKIVSQPHSGIINKDLLGKLRMDFYKDSNLVSILVKSQIVDILLRRENNSLEGRRIVEIAAQIEKHVDEVEGVPFFVKTFILELIDKKIIRGNQKRFGIRVPEETFEDISPDNYLAKKTFEKYGDELSKIKTFDAAVRFLSKSKHMFSELSEEEATRKAGSLIVHYIATERMG